MSKFRLLSIFPSASYSSGSTCNPTVLQSQSPVPPKLFKRYLAFPYVSIFWTQSCFQSTLPFAGSGSTLSGRSNSKQSTMSDNKGKAKADEARTATSNHNWGSSGQTLGSRSMAVESSVGVGGARVPQPPQRRPKKIERSPTPEDWGVDDDDVIMIDSD